MGVGSDRATNQFASGFNVARDSFARWEKDFRLDFHIVMTRISRRSMIRQVTSGVAGSSLGALPALSSAVELQSTQRKGRIRQSVSRWCYEKIPLEELCEKGAAMGLKAIDLLNEDEGDVPGRNGLVCSMGYGGGEGDRKRMNRKESTGKAEGVLRKEIP